MEVKNESNKTQYVIGIDVGTGSVRAGIFDLHGTMISTAVHPIKIFRPSYNHVEQSSEDIWQSICWAVRSAAEKSGVDPQNILAISFDSTCSLVALDANDQPVSLSQTNEASQNIIVWMDHRAEKQADEINQTKHRVLDYVGGKISPEQEIPKLKWIKENLPESWQKTAKFLDLADYLVYESCGENVRSLCTVVCKWTYMGHEGEYGSWDKSFFREIDLEDLFKENRVGDSVRPMGTTAGTLTEKAASELGLSKETIVGVGIIDAHAGGIGSLGMRTFDEKNDEIPVEQTLALIGGTSSCHMAVAPIPRFVKGVWGPYFGAMLDEMWLAEGGQSATGALLDHIIENHAYSSQLKKEAELQGRSIFDLLNQRVEELKTARAEPLTVQLHILPDFLGNRSPIADNLSRGMISGLTLDSSFDNLAVLYYAAIQAIAYGTRQIIDALNSNGYQINRIHVSGGGTKNPLWLQEHADITGCNTYIAKDCEPVLLGTAMLAATSAGKYTSVLEAMKGMSPNAEIIKPNSDTQSFHRAKYEVFKLMYQNQLEYKEIMSRAFGTQNLTKKYIN